MTRVLLAGLLLLLGLSAPRAQLSMTGVGPANSGVAAALTNLRITNTGAFRITNTAANRAVFP